MYMQSRTDLALEEQFPSDQISISTVNITTKNAAKALNITFGKN